MQKVQNVYFENNSSEYPKKWKFSHDYPAEIPERMSQHKDLNFIENGTPMICKHWACSKSYLFDDYERGTEDEICRFHPGSYEFGSVHVRLYPCFFSFSLNIKGLWPKGWTCCQKEWNAGGCKIGKHKGIPASKNFKLCINHGNLFCF